MTLLRDESSSWGRRPQTPGIYRIPARMTERGGRSLHLRSFRPLSRRSGCVPAVPYPPLRSFQSGSPQPRRAIIYQRTAITPLTSCLTPGGRRSQLRLQNELTLEQLRTLQFQNQQMGERSRAAAILTVDPDPPPPPDGHWWLGVSEFNRATYLWSTNKPSGKQKKQQQAVDRYYADPRNLSARVWDALARANWKDK